MYGEPLEDYKQAPKLKLKDLESVDSKLFTNVSCPSCGTETPADNININDKIAKCGQCNAIFPFQDTVASFQLNKKKKKQEIARPEGIETIQFQDELDITVQQPFPTGSLIFLFPIILFAIIFTFAALITGKVPLALGVFFWLTSIYPLITVLNRSKHKIYLNITSHYLSVKWRPKKMVRDQNYDVQDIEQLYVKFNPMTNHHVLFMIVNTLDGQKHVKLINGVDSLSKAKYLEQEIERHLNIEDREVLEEA
jgi:hypothetical protein